MNTVTKEEVLANMQDVICRTVKEFGKPTTYVTVRMKNGFTLRESTTCVDPKNYNEEEGKRICLQRIEDKIWFLLGYSLQEKLTCQSKNNPKINQKSDNDTVTIPKKEYCYLVERNKKLKTIEIKKQIEDFREMLNFIQSLDVNPLVIFK